MDTVSIQVDLPKDIMSAANISESKAQSTIKTYLAIYLFKERILSFGKAAELSGMDKTGFFELVGDKQIPLNYDVEDYFEDCETIKEVKI